MPGAAGPAPGAPTPGSPGWRRRSALNHVRDGFEPEAVERPGSSSNRYFFFSNPCGQPGSRCRRGVRRARARPGCLRSSPSS